MTNITELRQMAQWSAIHMTLSCRPPVVGSLPFFKLFCILSLSLVEITFFTILSLGLKNKVKKMIKLIKCRYEYVRISFRLESIIRMQWSILRDFLEI